MKQVFLMLVLINVMVFDARASYVLNVTGTNGNYSCTITSSVWTDLDLVTWVFPDGQIKQTTIILNNGIVQSGHQVSWIAWKPSSAWLAPKQVSATITKKGGTGNPSIIQKDHPVSSSVYAFNNTNTQALFTFPNNRFWKINPTWNFAKGADNYLIFTYKKPENCPIDPDDGIQITLPPKLTMISNVTFNNEVIVPINSSTYFIKNLYLNQDYSHVLLKLNTSTTAVEGEALSINVRDTICAVFDTTLTFEVNQHPHDPNQKRVDIKEICRGKNTPTLLHYDVQFHNEGDEAVTQVKVVDVFDAQLNPATFALTHAPTFNGIMATSTYTISGHTLEIFFNGPGLLGLGQTDQSVFYNQTIYEFGFDIETVSNVTKSFSNESIITFYDKKTDQSLEAQTPITTEKEWVYLGCKKKRPFCDCLKLLFKRKEDPKP